MYDCYILVNSTSLTNLKATKPLYPLSCSAVQSLMLIVKYSFKTNNEKNTIECAFYFMFYFEVVTVSGPLSTHWRICQWRWERSAAAVADFRVRRVRPRHRREHTHKKSLFFLLYCSSRSSQPPAGSWRGDIGLCAAGRVDRMSFTTKAPLDALHSGLIGWPMDPKHILICSSGSTGSRGPGVAVVGNNGNHPSFSLAEWILKASAAVVFPPRTSKRTRCVSGMLSIGAVLMLLMQSSLASNGKTDAAVPPQPVRVHVYSAP